jgi:hypothetical protein
MLTDKNNFVGKSSDYIIGNIYEKISGNSAETLKTKDSSELDENSSTKEKEDNNDFKSANTIEFQTTYLGNLKDEEDVDYYKFSNSSKSKLTIDFEHDNSVEGGFELKVYNLDEKEITDYLSLTDTENKNEKTYVSFSNLRLPEGDFYLVIDNYSLKDSIDINYFVTISYDEEDDSYESEFNNSLKTANEIKFGNEYRGNLVNSKDSDYYKFSVEETKKLKFSIQQADEGLIVDGIKIQFLTENEEEKIAFELNSDKDSKVEESFTLVAGDYYIKVSTDEDVTIFGDYIFNLE